jgi:hypothetical protein
MDYKEKDLIFFNLNSIITCKGENDVKAANHFYYIIAGVILHANLFVQCHENITPIK